MMENQFLAELGPEQRRTVLSRTAGERARFLLAVLGDAESSDPAELVVNRLFAIRCRGRPVECLTRSPDRGFGADASAAATEVTAALSN